MNEWYGLTIIQVKVHFVNLGWMKNVRLFRKEPPQRGARVVLKVTAVEPANTYIAVKEFYNY